MAADDLVREAIDELYSVDPDDFTDRRNALAARARDSGEKAVAKDIAALRKPTRSAFALNRLVRADTDAAARLAELGDDLRAAQDSLDGARMRELSTLRRGLVEELADQAFQVIGQRSPGPGLRDEVVSTLNAAVADEGVVEQLRTGTLLRPARWDGFGFASPPELSVVRPTAPRRPRDEPTTGSKAGSGTPTGTRPKATKTTAQRRREEASTRTDARAEARAEAKAEEQRRRQALADAQRTVKDADSALAKASRVEEEQQTKVRLLHEQLTDARRRLDEIRIDVRRAENRQRKARQALERQQK